MHIHTLAFYNVGRAADELFISSPLKLNLRITNISEIGALAWLCRKTVLSANQLLGGLK